MGDATSWSSAAREKVGERRGMPIKAVIWSGALFGARVSVRPDANPRSVPKRTYGSGD